MQKRLNQVKFYVSISVENLLEQCYFMINMDTLVDEEVLFVGTADAEHTEMYLESNLAHPRKRWMM